MNIVWDNSVTRQQLRPMRQRVSHTGAHSNVASRRPNSFAVDLVCSRWGHVLRRDLPAFVGRYGQHICSVLQTACLVASSGIADSMITRALPSPEAFNLYTDFVDDGEAVSKSVRSPVGKRNETRDIFQSNVSRSTRHLNSKPVDHWSAGHLVVEKRADCCAPQSVDIWLQANHKVRSVERGLIKTLLFFVQIPSFLTLAIDACDSKCGPDRKHCCNGAGPGRPICGWLAIAEENIAILFRFGRHHGNAFDLEGRTLNRSSRSVAPRSMS